MNGPPFGVTADEVRDLYAAQFDIQRLAVREMLDEEPRFSRTRRYGIEREHIPACATRLSRARSSTPISKMTAGAKRFFG